MKSYTPTFKIFTSPFDVNYKEVPLQIQRALIDLQRSEDLPSMFLSYHIIDYYKNHMLSSAWFPNFITYTQHVVSMFDTINFHEQLLFKMRLFKCTLRSQLLSHHFSDELLLSREVSSWCNGQSDGCGIVVSEFVLQSHYYVHFRTNTLGKGMNPLILPAMG